MFYQTQYIFLSFFVFIGIAQMLEYFVNWIYNQKNYLPEKEKIFLIPIKKHQENIEYIIRGIISKRKYALQKYKLKIICIVDSSSDQETVKICSLLARDFNFIKLKGFKSEIHRSDL